ncbi:MAG: hypothetical protein AMXMBFR13_41660 [Phycisphaerae bacterium]
MWNWVWQQVWHRFSTGGAQVWDRLLAGLGAGILPGQPFGSGGASRPRDPPEPPLEKGGRDAHRPVSAHGTNPPRPPLCKGGRGPAAAQRDGAVRRGGAVLLEVVISLALLVFGMAVVGLQVNGSLAVARSADTNTRALMAADTVLSYIDSGELLPPQTGEPVTDEDLDLDVRERFRLAYPGYCWDVMARPAEVDDLYLVRLRIGYNPVRAPEQMGNPETKIEIEDLDTRIVRTAYRLMAKPADISLDRDYGVTQEEMDEITQNVPIPGFDPTSIDPTAIAKLDPEFLAQFMPLIEQYLGQVPNLNELAGNPAMQRLLGQEGRGRRGRGGRRGGEGRREERPGEEIPPELGEGLPGVPGGPGDAEGGRGRGRGRRGQDGAETPNAGSGEGGGRRGGNTGSNNDAGTSGPRRGDRTNSDTGTGSRGREGGPPGPPNNQGGEERGGRRGRR